MQVTDLLKKQLDELGLKNYKELLYNLTVPQFYEKSIANQEAKIAPGGAVVAYTGTHTGRSPDDKFIVEERTSKDNVAWGDVNKPIKEEVFNNMFSKMKAYMQNRELFVNDCFAGWDEDYRLGIRVITEQAWHNLFVKNLFVEAKEDELQNFEPDYTVIQMPGLKADPTTDGTNSDVFVLVHFGKKLVLIGGSSYAGEIKKSVFTIMNYLLPLKGVMSMHCSANVGEDDDVAVLFGLSGTGKTTLSADPKRKLIGDDEHGWSDKGVFNFEGGCYAKVIRLSAEAEPDIYKTTKTFGTVLENVVMDEETGKLDLDDAKFTENTRSAYPLCQIPNIKEGGKAGHPKNIVMLTADAFGVLPPISRLTPEQAMYHFLSGYTAKVAGTEKGITEPKATFSTCFGAPFMALRPSVYANLLGEKIKEHGSKCWLVNTGWTGGPYGVGNRMKIKYTRAMLNAALEGKLDNVDTYEDPFFGLHIPVVIEGVPTEVLNPRNTWSDTEKYDEAATNLAKMFNDNFRQFEHDVTDEILKAAPKK